MGVLSPFISIFSLVSLISLTLSLNLPNGEQREILRQTMKVLLDFEKIPEPGQVLRSLSRSPSSASKHMKKLYEEYSKTDTHEDGNLVRSILPTTGKLNNEDMLVYDFSHIPRKEKILRVELHFSLREVNSNKRRARAVRALVRCTHSYCVQDYILPPIHLDSNGVSFDATLPFAQLYSLNGTQMAVKMWRKDIKMRPYRELIRRNAPFLLVFSESEETLDSQTVRETMGNHVRQKRDAGYFAYSSPDDVITDKVVNSEKKKGRRMRIRNKTKSRLSRKEEGARKDPWYGFGETTTIEKEEREEKEEEVRDERNEVDEDIDVVLLDGKRVQKTCSVQPFRVDFASLGWDEQILAPKSFDAGYCSGTCTVPLTESSQPSNRALLHSLLFPTLSICCSPQSLHSLTLLFVDRNENTVLRSFPRMLVKSCGCL